MELSTNSKRRTNQHVKENKRSGPDTEKLRTAQNTDYRQSPRSKKI